MHRHAACLQVGKTYAAMASRTQSVESAEAVQAEGNKAMEKVLIDQGKGIMWEVQNLSRSLRRVPQIDLFVPTVRSVAILACCVPSKPLLFGCVHIVS